MCLLNDVLCIQSPANDLLNGVMNVFIKHPHFAVPMLVIMGLALMAKRHSS